MTREQTTEDGQRTSIPVVSVPMHFQCLGLALGVCCCSDRRRRHVIVAPFFFFPWQLCLGVSPTAGVACRASLASQPVGRRTSRKKSVGGTQREQQRLVFDRTRLLWYVNVVRAVNSTVSLTARYSWNKSRNYHQEALFSAFQQ